MSCNSAIYTASTSPEDLQANAQIPFGSIVRRFGKNIDLEGSDMILHGNGYYKCDCSVTLEPAAAGNVSAQLYLNGEPYPGAIVTGYAAAGNPVPLSFSVIVRVYGCKCVTDTASLAVRLGDEPATKQNMAFTAMKL